jgi:hypothetical protein
MSPDLYKTSGADFSYIFSGEMLGKMEFSAEKSFEKLFFKESLRNFPRKKCTKKSAPGEHSTNDGFFISINSHLQIDSATYVNRLKKFAVLYFERTMYFGLSQNWAPFYEFTATYIIET